MNGEEVNRHYRVISVSVGSILLATRMILDEAQASPLALHMATERACALAFLVGSAFPRDRANHNGNHR